MHTIVLENNSKKDADTYVRTDNNENDKEQTGPRIVVISWHPGTRNKNK